MIIWPGYLRSSCLSAVARNPRRPRTGRRPAGWVGAGTAGFAVPVAGAAWCRVDERVPTREGPDGRCQPGARKRLRQLSRRARRRSTTRRHFRIVLASYGSSSRLGSHWSALAAIPRSTVRAAARRPRFHRQPREGPSEQDRVAPPADRRGERRVRVRPGAREVVGRRGPPLPVQPLEHREVLRVGVTVAGHVRDGQLGQERPGGDLGAPHTAARAPSTRS
jgi:hypothetical protein